MSVIRWDRYHQEMLIEKVRERTCLWDIRHPDYRNSHKKQALFDEVAAEIEQLRPGTSVDDVRKRWANLRCQFSENIRSARGKPGEPLPEKPRKLWCKEILMFLNDVTVPRTSAKHRAAGGGGAGGGGGGATPVREQQQQQQQAAAAVAAAVSQHQLQAAADAAAAAAGMGGPEGSMSSELDDQEAEEEEDEAASRGPEGAHHHDGTSDFVQCGSGCEGGAVSPDTCCFTPVSTSMRTLAALAGTPVPTGDARQLLSTPAYIGIGLPQTGRNKSSDPCSGLVEQQLTVHTSHPNLVCTSSAPVPAPTGLLPPLRPQDAIDKYALCVASELRQIRQPQQLVLAKWHIQNVLFQAQFGMLAGPPPPMAFGAGPSYAAPQETIVGWQQSPPPLQGLTTETGESKDTGGGANAGQQQHRPPSTQHQDYVRSLATV